MTAQLTSMPVEQRLRTTLPIPLSSVRCRVSAPSNKMMATESDTSGNSSSPSRASGSSVPVIGPSKRPLSSRNKMAGTRTDQASHCASSEIRAIPARESAIMPTSSG
ncbi:hypothetical protein D3C75_885500 [compost metagenome]